MNRLVAENFEDHYPIEQYQQYQAYCSNSLRFNAVKVQNAAKKTSNVYAQKLNKNTDFVMNSSILATADHIEYIIK